MRTPLTAGLCGILASLAFAGSALAAEVDGTSGRDQLRGTQTADAIHAKAGNDRVRGRGGSDRINAGAGRDSVAGGTGNDRINGGGGDDTLAGNAGNDVINAADGSADTVTCGAGTDVAKLDQDDVIADATAADPDGSCEKVVRPDSETNSDSSDPTDGSNCPGHDATGQSGPDTTDPASGDTSSEG
jgi:Ca2+-binding RTX toxin-like protein